jgi:hypothetical protein
MPFLGTTGGGSVKQYGGQANLGYFIKNSLRFRGANSAYLSRTPSVSGNRKVWTWSAWVKRGQLDSASTNRVLFGSPSQSGNDGIAAIYFASDQLHTYYDTSGANPYGPVGPRLYRDPAAWYHIVWAVDAANTIHYVYVNNTLVSTDAAYYPPNYDYSMNRSGYTHYFGTEAWGPSNYFDGYMAEVNFVDGQALTPSSFGKTDAATNQWIPKKFAGTYGTNGFYLKFADTSGITAATIGKDSSGNGNNFTPSGISNTTGSTYDFMIDSPTLSGAASNYATLNPLATSNFTYSNGNLKGVSRSSGDACTIATIGVTSGKWYFEGTIADNSYKGGIGILGTTTGSFASSVFDATAGNSALGYALQAYDGQKRNNSTSSAYYGSALPDSANVGIAFDLDNNKIFARVNGTWLASSDPVTGSNPMFNLTSGATYFPALSDDWGAQSVYWDINFGQRAFSYTAPTGFKSLNTFNLP